MEQGLVACAGPQNAGLLVREEGVRAPRMRDGSGSHGNSPHCQIERVSGRRRPGHGGDLGGSANEQDTQHCQTKDGRCGAGACGGQTDVAGHVPVVSMLVVTPVSLWL